MEMVGSALVDVSHAVAVAEVFPVDVEFLAETVAVVFSVDVEFPDEAVAVVLSVDVEFPADPACP